MKKLAYFLFFCCTSFTFACSFGSSTETQRDGTGQTDEEYFYYAEYPENKTPKLEAYLDSALHSHLKLDNDLDDSIKFYHNEKLNLKSSEGKLELHLNKKHSSVAGYEAFQKLHQGIHGELWGDN